MNSDLSRIVQPSVSSVKAVADTGTNVTWQVKRIGIDLLNDSLKKDLNAVSKQLSGITQKLDTIEKTTETVLRPIISLLRSIQDPFAAIINQLVQQVEQVLQAFDNQGIFILDMVTEELGNNAVAKAFFERQDKTDRRNYIKQLNQAIFRARAGVTTGPNGQLYASAFTSPQALADAGLKVDENGNIVRDPTSNRDDQERLLPSEVAAVNLQAQSFATAQKWLTQYNDELVALLGQIEDKFDIATRAATALNPGVLLPAIIGDPALDKADETGPTRDIKTYFKLPALSDLVTQEQKSIFLQQKNFFASGTDDFIVWNNNLNGVNLNSTTIFMPNNMATADDFYKNKNAIIEIIKGLASDIDAIEKQFANSNDIDTKTKQIYLAIEKRLKDSSSGTMLLSGVDKSKSSIIDRPTYLFFIQSALQDTTASTPAAIEKKLLIQNNLLVDPAKVTGPASVSTLTTADVIVPYAGFRNAKFMITRLRVAVSDTATREAKVFQKVIDFMQTQVETAGRTQNQFLPPVAKGNLTDRLRPPRQTPLAAEEDSSTSTTTTLTTEDQANAQQILDDVTKRLGQIDASKEHNKALKLKYRLLTLALSSNLRVQFNQLQTALVALQNDSAGATTITDAIQKDFHNIINAIINIKMSFYPFQASQQIATKIKSQITDQQSKNQLDLELLFNEAVIGSGFTGQVSLFFAIGTTYTAPSDIILSYINSLVKILRTGGDDSILTSVGLKKPKHDPFVLYQRGFNNNSDLSNFNQPGNIDDIIEFNTFFASIFQVMAANSLPPPATFFQTTNTFGFQQVIAGVVNRLNLISDNADTNLSALRITVLSDLAAADEARKCAQGSSGLKVPDPVKARNQKTIQDTQAQLAIATNRRQALTTQLASKIGQIDNFNKTTLSEKTNFVKNINAIIGEIGGALFTIEPGKTHGNIIETGTIVTGTLNQKIISLNQRINSLKSDNLNRDRTVADQIGDKNLRTQVFKNLAVANENLAIAQAKNPQDQGQIQALQKEIKYLNSINDGIIGSLDASVSQIYINNLAVVEVIDGAINGLDRIANDIDSYNANQNTSNPFTSTETSLLKNAVPDMTSFITAQAFALYQPGNPTNFAVSDASLTDDNLISLFTTAAPFFDTTIKPGAFQERLQTYIANSNALRTDADYSTVVPFASFRDQQGGNPRLPLGFAARQTELIRIKAALQLNMQDVQKIAKKERDDVNSSSNLDTWIQAKTKNSWITEFVATLRDPGDLRRPIFVDDISKVKIANAAAGFIGGRSAGEAAQKHIDEVVALGEMTAVFYLAVSTDVEKVVKDIQNLYYFLVDPKKFRQRLDEFSRKISKNFEDLEGIIDDPSIRGMKDYFGSLLEDGFDRLLDSVHLFDNTDAHCIKSFKSANRPLRNDRWISIKLSDIFILAYAFNAIQKFLDKLKNIFKVKLGLADLLEDLLNFIKEKIELLKKIAAGIGLMIELIDFIGSLNFNVATITIPNIRSVSQIEQTLRTAKNFPQPLYAQGPDDLMYILAVVIIMPSSFFGTFSKWFHEKPAPPAFNPADGFLGAIDNLGAGPTSIDATGISGLNTPLTGAAGSGSSNGVTTV